MLETISPTVPGHLINRKLLVSGLSCTATALTPNPTGRGGGGSGGLEACAFVGADLLTVSWKQEEKLKQESAPFKLSSAARNSIFLNKDLYIFIQAQILIGRC